MFLYYVWKKKNHAQDEKRRLVIIYLAFIHNSQCGGWGTPTETNGRRGTGGGGGAGRGIPF